LPNPTFQSHSFKTFLQPDISAEPKIIKSALSKPHWLTTMNEELATLKSSDTWMLVPRQPHMIIVGSRWVFKTKVKSDGSVEPFKAHLVAKGYGQLAGIDFDDTFSPVVKTTTIHILLSIATTLHWEINQLDVKNAFLHSYFSSNLCRLLYLTIF